MLHMELLPPDRQPEMPSAAEVRDLYLAAASEPPLNETEEVADLFARLYEVSLEHEAVTGVVTYDSEMLTGFAYGHRWWWAKQQNEWARSLYERLGDAADMLDGTYALTMLARHPRVSGTGTGRAVLKTWLDGIGQTVCWLQTSDMDTPATRLYQAQGFARIGHGPDAPNGEPGLVLLRNAKAR